MLYSLVPSRGFYTQEICGHGWKRKANCSKKIISSAYLAAFRFYFSSCGWASHACAAHGERTGGESAIRLCFVALLPQCHTIGGEYFFTEITYFSQIKSSSIYHDF